VISLDVVMPYYGDAAYLLRAVESVRTLVHADWRLTIVEDCYPGGTAAEQAVHALGDNRIRYLRNERNLGVAANTHRCFELAEREFVLVTDYDDLLLPNYAVEVAGLFDRHPGAVIAQPAVEVVDENDRPHRPLPDRVKSWLAPRGEAALSGERAVASLLRGNWLYCPALCYRRAAVADVKPRPNADAVHDLARAVDVLRWAGPSGGSVAVGATVAFRYRRHRSSHSSDGARTGVRFEQERGYFEAIAAELAADGWPHAARAARQRPLSRLNAVSRLPAALASRNSRVARALVLHAAAR
jgi:glycosyltransferase involved in cell wall biosynthesis